MGFYLPSTRAIYEKVGGLPGIGSRRLRWQSFGPRRAFWGLAHSLLRLGDATTTVAAPPIETFDRWELFLRRRTQRAVCWRRRCSLAFINSLMSNAGRISKMLPYFRDGCCAMSC